MLLCEHVLSFGFAQGQQDAWVKVTTDSGIEGWGRLNYLQPGENTDVSLVVTNIVDAAPSAPPAEGNLAAEPLAYGHKQTAKLGQASENRAVKEGLIKRAAGAFNQSFLNYTYAADNIHFFHARRFIY